MDADFDAIRAVWRRISGGGDAKQALSALFQ
jgi:hypothetical protein